MTEKKGENQPVAFSKEKTNPFGRRAYRPRRRLSLFIAFLAVALALPIAYWLLRPREVPHPAKAKDRLAVQLRINEIRALETEARLQHQRLWDMVCRLAATQNVDAAGWDLYDPSEEQKNILSAAARRRKPLAREILEGMAALERLKTRIAVAERDLGEPVNVIPGDTHFRIAYEYLIRNCRLADAEARGILARIRLQDPLIPGFKVWNFRFPDGFYTFVTQGEAPLTPEEARQRSLELETEQTLRRLNSLRYLTGTEENLLQHGILAGGFLKNIRLHEVQPGDFRQSLDLRRENQIILWRRPLGVQKITAVRLYPDDFQRDRDYRVEIEKRGHGARVIILIPDRFKNREIVIAVK